MPAEWAAGSTGIRSEIAKAVASQTPSDGEFTTVLPHLHISRKSRPSEPYFTVQWPCFALVAQGAKSLLLGSDTYRYGVGDYLVVSADLPVHSSVTTASRDRPNLGIGLALDPQRIGALLDRIDVQRVVRTSGAVRGVAVDRAPPELLDATLRLVRLLDRPGDAPALGPLFEEEIAYHLLRGPCGERMLHLVAGKSGEAKAHTAARWLRENFAEPLRLDELARVSGMSVSSLHHHFKALTGMSPLQYQKQLRLQEARRALVVEGLDVTTAGMRVGYSSLSQFSREYTRQFGTSPRNDLRKASRAS
ncbi:AraC family transcriptional regulator [Sorangium sp. So ce327]|uniref:AraC family transcriptional regulator n=1 Tax=Sorangium sp. So ce327 TaxID=3133301 RepID=UPI003F5D58EA